MWRVVRRGNRWRIEEGELWKGNRLEDWKKRLEKKDEEKEKEQGHMKDYKRRKCSIRRRRRKNIMRTV